MVKKIYNGLILFFFISLLIFYGNRLSIREYEKITNDFFNATIYLKTEVSQENTIKVLMSIADEYDWTIVKLNPSHKGGRDLFVYSHNNKYVHDFLFSNGFIKELTQDQRITYTNDLAVKNTGTIHTFYNKEIAIRPLTQLHNTGVEGKYTLHVENPSNIGHLVDEINDRYGKQLMMYANENFPNTFTGNVESLKYYYGMILVAILFITLLTSFLYDIESRKKEIAIKRLLGYSIEAIFFDIFKNQAIKPIVFSVLLSELMVIPFFIFHKNIKSLNVLKTFLKGSVTFSILFAAIFMVIFGLFLLINLTRKSERIHMVSYLKGKVTSKSTLSVLVKMGSTLVIILTFGASAVSWNFVSNKLEALHRWEGTKNYATLKVYIPNDILHNPKRAAEFERTHKAIWNYLNEKDGLLFYKTTNRININPWFVDNKEVEVPFIYINENYLKENPVLDISGNRIVSVDHSDSNTITILVPSRYQPYMDELKEILHKKHVWDRYISEDIIRERTSDEEITSNLVEENLNNPEIRENFIYIKDSQPLFTYAPGGDFVTDGVLAVVNGGNMGLNVYTPSSFGSSAGIKAKYSDINELHNETRVLFKDLGYGEVESDFDSVYQQNAEDVDYFKTLLNFSLIVFVLSLLFLIFSLLFYIEIYIQNNRKKIAVKNSLGYNFFSRNKLFFISLFLQDGVMIVIGLMVGSFITNFIVGIQILGAIWRISLMVLLFDICCSAWILKTRESKFIAETLKGE